MQITKLNRVEIVRASIALVLFVVVGAIMLARTSEELRPGSRYKVVGTLCLTGVYRNLNDRQLNREMALASLTVVRISGPEIAFQRKLPIGTIVTITGPAPKRVPLPFYAKQYLVRLEPAELSNGLDVILELNRGIEGSVDGLNPEFFGRP